MKIKVAVNAGNAPLAATAVEIMRRVLQTRAGITVDEVARDADVTLALDPALPVEGYAMANERRGVRITGGAPRGLLYGVGRWLRDLEFDGTAFRHGAWRGQTAPKAPVRGVYFATHFTNYYDQAPLAEIETYLEDLALWGCNTLKVWFDLHHFSGIGDPRAQKQLDRLRAMARAAHRVGMDFNLGGLANEAYDSSPEHLRADWTCGHDGYNKFATLHGHYHRELCPSKPGALELLLQWRGEVFDAFADVGVEYVSVGAYDQGGCTCPQCAPWGVNGYLKTAEAVARLARQKIPNAKFILGTWRFDYFTNGEWAGLRRAFARRPDWVDFITLDLNCLKEITPEAPGGLPVLGFPEISMRGMNPWGGYGANPMPKHLKNYWDQGGAHLAGMSCYSEGLYEDLNKIVGLQLQWAPDRPVSDIVAEYAVCYFGGQTAVDVAQGVEILEAQLGHCAYLVQNGKKFDPYAMMRQVNPKQPWQLEHHAGKLTGKADQAAECLALFQRADAGMTAAARQTWRWRILLLRARIDAELANGQAATPALDECLRELTRLYHAENCETGCLVPPLAETYARIFKQRVELWL